MTKTFTIENLDCANCAEKIARGIAEIDGVNSCDVNFFLQKFTLDANDANFNDVLKKAKKVINKYEPDVVLN